VAGDDLRILDWNLYGRMERLLVRLFEEDEDLAIDILCDASASMSMGAPPKLDLALQVGAALAYVGLANLDRVAVTTVGATPGALAAYERRHAAHLRGLGAFCRERAIPCFAVSSDEAFDAVVLRVFRAGGLLG